MSARSRFFALFFLSFMTNGLIVRGKEEEEETAKAQTAIHLSEECKHRREKKRRQADAQTHTFLRQGEKKEHSHTHTHTTTSFVVYLCSSLAPLFCSPQPLSHQQALKQKRDRLGFAFF